MSFLKISPSLTFGQTPVHTTTKTPHFQLIFSAEQTEWLVKLILIAQYKEEFVYIGFRRTPGGKA